MTYAYNKPRRLNLVSGVFLLVVIAAGYAGYKFVPVFWQARKVDEVLDGESVRAASFHRVTDEVRQPQAEGIVTKAIAKLYELGIDDQPDQPLQVWFSPDYTELNARYLIVVQHPFGKSTLMTMNRTVQVPQD
jgi:hypothetical protein